jgi:hypothetical protein
MTVYPIRKIKPNKKLGLKSIIIIIGILIFIIKKIKASK